MCFEGAEFGDEDSAYGAGAVLFYPMGVGGTVGSGVSRGRRTVSERVSGEGDGMRGAHRTSLTVFGGVGQAFAVNLAKLFMCVVCCSGVPFWMAILESGTPGRWVISTASKPPGSTHGSCWTSGTSDP